MLNNHNKKVELLAPAGDEKSFYGAINAGADAVYLAGKLFGARAYASNFETEQLVSCIKYAHLFQKKVYLTLNTLIKESEIVELYDYIYPLYEAHIDGVIVQDLGVFRFIKENFPGLELHGSTQMSICTKEGATALKNMGATRIVPAREISLNEIKAIKKHVEIEIETFIHGSMCYCYSGQCLFSSILGGRSGNRGRCAQPCRLPYSVKNTTHCSKEGYYLSLKDMCTIEHIPDFIEAGIDSFKIEGRMKRAEYACGVTSIYRKYIDKYYALREQYGAKEAKNKYFVSSKDFSFLRSLYIRSEIQNGYYFKHNGKDMISIANPSYSGTDETVVNAIEEKYLNGNFKLPITIEAKFFIDQKACLKLYYEDISVLVEGDVVENAAKQPITIDNISKQLSKLGDTVFSLSDINVFADQNAFYPLKKINDLRREACSELEKVILRKNGYQTILSDNDNLTDCQVPIQNKRIIASTNLPKPMQNKYGKRISVQNMTQLVSLKEWIQKHAEFLPEIIYISSEIIMHGTSKDNNIFSYLKEKTLLFINLPYITRDNDLEKLEQLFSYMEENDVFSGVLIHSIDQYGFVKNRNIMKKIHADAGFYVWNSQGLRETCLTVDNFCFPYELKSSEQKAVLVANAELSFEKIVYSRIPMMISANCVLKTSQECNSHNNSLIFIKDRYGKEFPVVRDCTHCTNVIYNCIPFSVIGDMEKWIDKCNLRIDFTIETPAEMVSILDAFFFNCPLVLKEHTTGHEKRGVE